MKKLPCKRVLLKLSGESLAGAQKFGIEYSNVQGIARSIKKLKEMNLEIAIVIGGGNIFRGINLKTSGISRTPADQIGMLATIMNGITLQEALNAIGCQARVMSALECPKAVEPYNWHHALEVLEKKEILIFVGGTGNPYFTTDTAAALRASEIHADALLKATKVDGIYNKDPIKHKNAVMYKDISYSQILAEKLEVMDATAIAMCMNNNIPIIVFNMQLLGTDQMLSVLEGKQGTKVQGE